jgi:hypothetical protein
MDIFAHALWTGALYKGVNKKRGEPFNVWLAIFWGIFPDLFAFAPLFLGLIVNLLFGNIGFSDLPRPHEIEPPIQGKFSMFQLTRSLYNICHSAIIFTLIFCLVFVLFRKPIWEMGGWLLHIFIDIPTHSAKFYPTPFLWPLSHFHISGISWAQPWFMMINYSAIVIVYILLHKKKMVQAHNSNKKINTS